MEAAANVSPHPADPLKAFADRRCDALWDVVALLHAVADRIDATQSALANDPAHQTLRLVEMARNRIDEIANELFAAV